MRTPLLLLLCLSVLLSGCVTTSLLRYDPEAEVDYEGVWIQCYREEWQLNMFGNRFSFIDYDIEVEVSGTIDISGNRFTFSTKSVKFTDPQHADYAAKRFVLTLVKARLLQSWLGNLLGREGLIIESLVSVENGHLSIRFRKLFSRLYTTTDFCR